MTTFRSPDNPIITPEDITASREDFEVIGVFNAGVARVKEQVILLLRVAERPAPEDDRVVLAPVYDIVKNDIILKDFFKDDPRCDFSDPRLIKTAAGTYLTSISHLRVARSRDGINFEIEGSPSFLAAEEYEVFGIEDPRITCIGSTYYVSYVAVSPLGITTALASTENFKFFERHGVIFCPDNKDVVIFPERINGKYYALHRPVSGLFGKQDIWLAESPDLRCWGGHRHLMSVRPGFWDEEKIGAGAVPFRIEQGWLEVYHGADRKGRYSLGAVLTDADKPWKIIARTAQPILEPQADYETKGFFSNVVFSCGLIYEQNKLRIYYGVADNSIAYAEIPLLDVLEALRP